MRRSTVFKISHFPEISKTIMHSTFQGFLLKTLSSTFLQRTPDSAKVMFFLGCVAEVEKFHEISTLCFHANKMIDPNKYAQYCALEVRHHLSKQAFEEFLQHHPDQNEICKNSGLLIGLNDAVFIGMPKSLTKKPEFDGNLWVHTISSATRKKEENLILEKIDLMDFMAL